MDLTGRGVSQKPARAAKDPGHLARVRTLPCAIGHHFGDPCEGAVAAHHICHDRHGTLKSPDSMAIPLCWGHHQGPRGIHANKRAWRLRFGPDHSFVPWVWDRLGL